jgi:adenosylcobyric acid synthase
MQELESKNKPAKCIAVFGTGSDVGKSLIATALCSYYSEKGFKTVPFKAQNMSNNSGVTPEGLEMGRAQIVQAEAAGVSPHVDMNPILLKPVTDIGAQVVLFGKVLKNTTAAEYHTQKHTLFQSAAKALDRLRNENDIVIIEGAGSCAEVNLMEGDIVNFKIAEYADADVILVGDIHRGGVFGQIVGTLECLPQKFRDMISGLIINRFRGDISLFHDGTDWIEKKTGKPVLGVLPWASDIIIESEDSVVVEQTTPLSDINSSKQCIAIIKVPHISNFTDFQPLNGFANIGVYYIDKACDLSAFSAVILPGSKNTRHDLEWLKKTKWDSKITDYAENGGCVTGICGGYQILGRSIHDPKGVEGKPGSSEGLNLLPVETTLMGSKTTTVSTFIKNDFQGQGYEIHMGETTRNGGSPFCRITSRNMQPCNENDGCISDKSNVMGTYLHGLFDAPEMIRYWFALAGINKIELPELQGLKSRQAEYKKLLGHFKKYITMDKINLN